MWLQPGYQLISYETRARVVVNQSYMVRALYAFFSQFLAENYLLGESATLERAVLSSREIPIKDTSMNQKQ